MQPDWVQMRLSPIAGIEDSEQCPVSIRTLRLPEGVLPFVQRWTREKEGGRGGYGGRQWGGGNPEVQDWHQGQYLARGRAVQHHFIYTVLVVVIKRVC